MYNGIGLKTARGSGTNGFVQRNLSYIRPSRILQFTQKHDQQIVEPKIKKQDDAILKHQVRRKIELELLELEDKMKEQGYLWIDYIEYRYTKEEIDTRIEAERKIRTSMMDSDVEKLRKMKEKQETRFEFFGPGAPPDLRSGKAPGKGEKACGGPEIPARRYLR